MGRHLGVARRYGQLGVPQQDLDDANIRIRFQQMHCEAVAEGVRCQLPVPKPSYAGICLAARGCFNHLSRACENRGGRLGLGFRFLDRTLWLTGRSEKLVGDWSKGHV